MRKEEVIHSMLWYDLPQSHREEQEHLSCVSWKCSDQNQVIPRSFVSNHHHGPQPVSWPEQGLNIVCIILVLEPVPRKSQDVIIILSSLLLGSGHFTGEVTDTFFGRRYPSRVTTNPSIRLPSGWVRSRLGTWLLTDGVYGPPIPSGPAWRMGGFDHLYHLYPSSVHG